MAAQGVLSPATPYRIADGTIPAWQAPIAPSEHLTGSVAIAAGDVGGKSEPVRPGCDNLSIDPDNLSCRLIPLSRHPPRQHMETKMKMLPFKTKITKMKIKISNSDADKDRLRAALEEINGAATAHTAGVWDCIDQAQKAEAHLEALGLTKKDRIGAVRVHISGERVSNAYMRKNWSDRVATRIRLDRGSTCWYITSIARTAVGQNGGWSRTRLTVAQRDIATARFQNQFTVLQVPVPVLMVAADMAIIKATGGEA